MSILHWGQLAPQVLRIMCGIALVSAANAQASDRRPWTHYGMRPLGMGNAFVAVADDYNALFYNPAGLAFQDDWSGEFFNPRLTINARTLELMRKVAALSASSQLSDILDIIEKQGGKAHYLGMAATPHLTFPSFGIGLGADLFASTTTHRDLSLDFLGGLQAVLPLMASRAFFEGRLGVGGGFKLRFDSGVDTRFSLDSLGQLRQGSEVVKNAFRIGQGLGVDLGLIWRPSAPMKPTLGLTIADLGNTTYKALPSSPGGIPKVHRVRVNTGVSLQPWTYKKHAVLVAMDIHGINTADHFSHKWHAGVEWAYGPLVKVQYGLHKGYWTSGIQLDARFLKLRLATYAEDFGVVVGQDTGLVQRRVLGEFKFLI